MQLIQNLACIQAVINPSDRRISLNKDILRGKKILSMFIFTSTVDFTITSPYDDDAVAQNSQLVNISLFSNLYDIAGNNFLKDYLADNIILDSEFKSDNQLIEYPINRILDVDKSFITYKGDLPSWINSLKLLVFVSYQTQNFSLYTDEINGSISFDIPVSSTNQDIKLSDIVNYTLKGKPIKQILIKNAQDKPLMGYLDLYCKHNRIENIPTCILQNHSQKEFVLDKVDIDFEKSFYRSRGDYQNPKITFIY